MRSEAGGISVCTTHPSANSAQMRCVATFTPCRRIQNAMRWGVLVMTLAWLGALVMAPYAVAHLHRADPAFAGSAVLYVVGGLVCHQRPGRSFHLWGAQFPVCARCAGLYAGSVLGAVLAIVAGRRRNRRPSGSAAPSLALQPRRAILLCAIPTVITLFAEWLLGTDVGNVARAMAGLPLGAAAVWAILLGAPEEGPGAPAHDPARSS
jgi:uncharacterized membrane protein